MKSLFKERFEKFRNKLGSYVHNKIKKLQKKIHRFKTDKKQKSF